MDSFLKSVFADSMFAQEIVVVNPLKEMIDEILDHLQQERSRESAGITGADAAAAPSAAGMASSSVLDVPLAMLVTAQQLEADVDDELPRWRDYLDQQVAQFVRLIEDPATYVELSAKLRDTVAKDKFGGNVLLWYDVKTAGEASSNPNCRTPPFRAAHLKKMVQGFVRCRGSSEVQPSVISSVVGRCDLAT